MPATSISYATPAAFHAGPMLLGCVLPRGSSTRNGTQGPGWGAVPVSAAQRMPGRERGRHREGRGRGTQGGPSGVGTPAPGIQGSWIRAWHRARTTRPGRDDERYARSDAIREVNGRRPAQTGRRFFFFAARAYFDDPIAVADRRRPFVRFVTARECYLLDADCIRTGRQPASKRGDAGTATSRSRDSARTLGAAAAGNTYRQR